MYVADGINDGAILGVSANFTNFTISLWFRTETTLHERNLFGVMKRTPTRSLKTILNAEATTGRVQIIMNFDAASYDLTWDDAALFDGAWHLLVIRRNGNVVTVRVDGVFPIGATENSLMDSLPVVFGRPFAAGAMNDANNLVGHCACDIGQWALWDAPASDADLLRLAAGESPANLSVAPVELWRCMTATLDTPTDQALGFLLGTMSTELLGGYHVYSKMTTAPAIGVDVPVLRLAADAVSTAIPESLLGLTANGAAHMGVGAFGLGGPSDLSRWSFPTDAGAHPKSVPSPVVLNAATALANGIVEVRFHYDELLSLATAERFRVEFQALSGQTPPAAAYVTHVPPRREYIYRSGSLADGGWRVRVYSERAGVWDTVVQSLDVTSDSTPPVGTVGVLEVF